MHRLSASFRDPAGFLFKRENRLFRYISETGVLAFDQLGASGLYEALVHRGWLVPHKEADALAMGGAAGARIIEPQLLPFISYPYEWSFSQLQDAALRTLDIQALALQHGMVLRDANAYNIQFMQGKPVLIDTLSFGIYVEGQPWVAYRQFCQHFLAPLLLMSKRDIRLGQLARVHLDGIPLDLASPLLPTTTWLQLGSLMHLHLHARAQVTYASSGANAGRTTRTHRSLSRNGMLGIVSSLRSTVQALRWKPTGTEWADYYQNTNYTDEAFAEKSKIVAACLDQIAPHSVWDLGANTGVFSRLAGQRGIPTVAFDIDPAAVEIHYRTLRDERQSSVLPLVLDLTNPSASSGWANAERDSLAARGPADCVLALALIHHLAISNNVPLDMVAKFFSSICRFLILEFVPKSDSQVVKLLRSRVDIFKHYDEVSLEQAFAPYFQARRKMPIAGTMRTMYFFERRSSAEPTVDYVI